MPQLSLVPEKSKFASSMHEGELFWLHLSMIQLVEVCGGGLGSREVPQLKREATRTHYQGSMHGLLFGSFTDRTLSEKRG